MTLGVIPNPQFVGLSFDLIDSPIYDQVDGRGFKLYVKLRRFVWRKETGPLGEYFKTGHLAMDGYLSQWAEWLGVSKPTVSRILNQLEEAGWIKWVVRSTKGGESNVLILGRWISVDGKRVEVYFVDTLAGEAANEQADTVSPVKQTVSGVKQTVSPVKPSNIEPNREPISTPNGGGERPARSVSAPTTFQGWQEALSSSKNKPAVLRRMFVTLYGHVVAEEDLPTFGYLGRAAKQVGGPGRLADLLWQHSTRPPTGDVLAFLMGVAKRNGGNGNGNGNRNRTTVLAAGSGAARDHNTPTDAQIAEARAARRAHRERQRQQSAAGTG